MCLSKGDDASIVLMSQAVDFIEDNLKEAIAVADVAEAVSFSLYHFCRTFNRVTHHTPYDYLMRRRLSEAAQALLGSDRKIIDTWLPKSGQSLSYPWVLEAFGPDFQDADSPDFERTIYIPIR